MRFSPHRFSQQQAHQARQSHQVQHAQQSQEVLQVAQVSQVPQVGPPGNYFQGMLADSACQSGSVSMHVPKAIGSSSAACADSRLSSSGRTPPPSVQEVSLTSAFSRAPTSTLSALPSSAFHSQDVLPVQASVSPTNVHSPCEAAGLRARTYSRIGQAPPGSGTIEAYEPCMASTLQGVFQVKNTFIELVDDPVVAEDVVRVVPGIGAALRSAPARYTGPLVTSPMGVDAEGTDGAEGTESQASLAQEPPSIGSALHDGKGQCSPCAWFWKPQGCASADQCKYCHSCPEGELKMRRRAKVAALKSEAALAVVVQKEQEAQDGEMLA